MCNKQPMSPSYLQTWSLWLLCQASDINNLSIGANALGDKQAQRIIIRVGGYIGVFLH